MTKDALSVMAETVKENVSALDVGAALGLEIRHGRCKCPIHNGGDFNCVLYKGRRGFYCHTCKAGGDVIRLVRETIGTDMPFTDLLRWFNGTFSLGLDIDSKPDKKRFKSAKNALKRKADERRFRERMERADFDMYLAIGTALDRMEKQRDDNRPRRYSDEWNTGFCDAVGVIPEIKKYLDYFAIQSTVVRDNE